MHTRRNSMVVPNIKPSMFLVFFCQIIGARHLVRQGRGICSPLVEVEVCGISEDRNIFRTVTCSKCYLQTLSV